MQGELLAQTENKPDLSTWPRVTYILETTGVADFTLIKTGDFYKQRGADVHLYCESIDRNEPDYWSGSEHAGFAAAYQLFKKETGFVPKLIEHPVYNEIRRYKGTLDRTGTYANNRQQLVLLDIKTGAIGRWVRLQTAAYAACLLQPETILRQGLQLRGDGTYKLSEPFTDYRTDSNMFFSLVSAVHGRSLYGKIEVGEE